MLKIIRNLSVFLFACLANLLGCSTTTDIKDKSAPMVVDKLPQEVTEVENIAKEKSDLVDVEIEKEIRSFSKGDWILYKNPLPSYQPIYLTWKKSGKTIQTSLAYHGWDLNYDGQLDMFEGVDIEGNTYIKLYDFDFDGYIDHIRQREDIEQVEQIESLKVK